MYVQNINIYVYCTDIHLYVQYNFFFLDFKGHFLYKKKKNSSGFS